jgi:DNA-directed RNA polymerase subunit beta
MAGRHGNKGVVSIVVPTEDMPFLEDGTPIDIILNPTGVPGRMNLGQVLETHLGWASRRLGFRAITPVFDGAKESEIEAELARAWLIDSAWDEIADKAWTWLNEMEYDPEMIEDVDEVRNMYLENWLGELDYDVFRLLSDQDYARRSVLIEWLREKGLDPDEILAFEDETFTDDQRLLRDDNAVMACLSLWLTQEGEKVKGLTKDKLIEKVHKMILTENKAVPIFGKQILRDGKTGEPYDRPVTVGVMTILKLHHLVEDKVHARSTGPYSLVSQQPLGGKAQFGGQRFGEMEVWALEAYGAAHTLQEMLTLKSDDVQGRVKAYEAIVKGEPIEDPSIPASFKVLVKELQSLGLSVEGVSDTGDVIKFGKDEARSRPPRLSTGLLGLGDF